jgi:mono/diheme cytochrome c family protein
MIRGFLLLSLLFAIALVAVFGFRGQTSTGSPLEIFPDMVRQMKVRAQAPLGLFADGRGPRTPVTGTVPIGYEMPKSASNAATSNTVAATDAYSRISFSAGTDYANTGKMGDHWGTGIPLQVTPELMERGRQRFNITCAMCHGATAAGNGITKQYGLATVVTLQDDRIRKMADGEVFNTITNGKNTMMAYGPTLMVADRWAIIAYLRALQRSQGATIADVPPEHRADLDKPAENKPPESKQGENKPPENKPGAAQPSAKPEAPKK